MKVSSHTLLLCLTALFTEQAPAASSADTRGEKFLLLYVDPVGFSPYFGQGIAGGLILTRSLVLEAGATHSRSCASQECQFETVLQEARVKFFPGNSFYLNAGVARERAVWNHRVAWGHAEDNADFIADVETVGGVFAIGNMWQHAGFTIGCDWFGFYVPHRVTDLRFRSGPDYTDSSREDDEQKTRTKALGIHLQFTRFHLGMAI
jgi:hypothetical protein